LLQIRSLKKLLEFPSLNESESEKVTPATSGLDKVEKISDSDPFRTSWRLAEWRQAKIANLAQ